MNYSSRVSSLPFMMISRNHTFLINIPTVYCFQLVKIHSLEYLYDNPPLINEDSTDDTAVIYRLDCILDWVVVN